MQKLRNLLYQLLGITVGTTLIAIALNLFFAPHDLVTGGVMGLALIIYDFTKNSAFPIEYWMTNIILNVPLFIVAIILKGKQFILRTAYATAYLTFALYFTQFIPAFEADIVVSSVFGGVICGLGLGLVFRCYATTGGSDTFSSILQSTFLKHIEISKILFAVDAAIVCAGFLVFGMEAAMYAIIAVYVTSSSISYVLEGLSFAKAVFIISDKDEEISDVLLNKLNRGATSLFGKGVYTGKSKNVLLCVVSKKEIVRLKEAIKDIDSDAFVIVADVREVLGLGFGEA